MTMKDLETMRHSTAHILAQAVLRLWPNAKLGMGPAIENGFYYDFDDVEIKEDDFPKIEAEMKKIVKENQKFEKTVMNIDDAIKLLEGKKQEYTAELAKDLKKEGKKEVSFYKNGEFINMCKGPHISYTKGVKHFKLLKIAAAYWKGDEKNKMLTRIYGTAFQKECDLKHYLHTLEEAEKRSHRKIGKKLDLFSINEKIGPGLPVFHPKGTVIRNELMKFVRKQNERLGFKEVWSPHIANSDLWKSSGHYEAFKDDMYIFQADEQEYALKPMNCPFHIQIYKSRTRSYRDLPLAFSEFGVVYRHEKSGELSGLFRVRALTQDDGHAFIREDQIESFVLNIIRVTFDMFEKLGFKKEELNVKLSTMPERHIGDEKIWEKATLALKKSLDDGKVKYELKEGEGAFYGPKIDIDVKDSLDRYWQLTTIQLDFFMPERFDLKYVDKNNKEVRPIIVHRALLGTLERFIGVYIEHCDGAFPLWMAPIQAVVINFTDDYKNYAGEIEKKLRESGIRVEGDYRSESVQYKIREAEVQRIPLIIVVGEKEKKNKTIAVRRRGQKKVEFGVELDDFVKSVLEIIKNKE